MINMTSLRQTLWSHIRTVPDFPKKGICFYDLTPLFAKELDLLTDALIAALPEDHLQHVESFVAVEARGFVLATLLAQRLQKGLLLVRKAGKLPPPVECVSYSLEYGADQLEMSAQIEAQKVILVDDVLATGGTLKAVNQLSQKCGHQVLGAVVLLDLPDLHADLGLVVWHVLDNKF